MNERENELIKNALIAISLKDEAAITKGLESVEELPEEFYQELDENVNKKIKEYEKHVSLKKTIAILVAATLLISIFSVTAFAGEKIKDFFVEIFDTHSRLTVDENEKPSSDYTIDITYIPDNFVITKEKKDFALCLYEWKNEDAIITLAYNIATNSSLNIDTENSNYTTITFEKFAVHRTEKYGQIDAIWTDGKMIYSLSGYGVKWEEMVKIIEGITLTESE